MAKKVEKGIMPVSWPEPIVIASTKLGDKEYFQTVAFVGGASVKPPIIMIGCAKGHKTSQAILESKEFGINVVSEEMMKQADFVGFVSGEEYDKSKLFEIYYGKLENVPLIKSSPMSYLCKIGQKPIETESHYIFLGEIVSTKVDEEILTEKKYDWNKMKPLLYNSNENTYWTPGESVGEAYSEGREFLKDYKKKEN